MVRSYILNPEQREIIEEYLEHRPNVMSPKIRQIRLRVKRLAFDEMHSDIDLLIRLKKLQIPKGRKAKNVAAGFTVRPKEKSDVAASFEIKTEPITFATSGLTIKDPKAPEEKK